MNSDSPLILPDERIVGPDGAPVSSQGPEVVGLDIYEAEGGADSLALIAAIAELRKTREPVGTLVAAPGAVTEAVMVEARLFNEEVYQQRKLTEAEEKQIRTSVTKQFAKQRRRAARAKAQFEGETNQALGKPSKSQLKRERKQASTKKARARARRAAKAAKRARGS